MEQIKTAAASLIGIAAFLALLKAASQEYKCMPYDPPEDCKLSRYEVRVHNISDREKRLIGVAEGSCVYSVGQGRTKRYVMPEASFSSYGRTEYLDHGAEFPAVQSLVCEVK